MSEAPRLTMADRDCMKHPHVRPVEDSVSSKIERLLANADGLMTGSEYHVLFDARGEQHANEVARRDAANVAERLPTSVSSLNSAAGLNSQNGSPL